MRKILSLIVFTAALVWTWNIIHSSTAVGFETHSGIQEKLVSLITETVKNKRPQAKDFRVTKLWTETIDTNKVRAVFAYKFNEPGEENESTEQSVEGEAILHREPSADDHVDKWLIQSVRTTGDAINFSEGTIITPVPGADEQPQENAQ